MIQRHRHTIRLPKHNYSSPETYFITIGTYHHNQIFGKIKNKIYIPNEITEILKNNLNLLPQHHPCKIISYQIMPNHLHIILKIGKSINQTITLGQIIRYFKAKSTFDIRKQEIYFAQIFQRNYYEHIIRDKKDLFRCQKYILLNPQNWYYDEENPKNIKKST
ncbi:MAG TPA: transposase [Candidatus Woesebacteria bacterium]|nr:transposase [Candidatus Woesebacteria bacterium]